MRIITVAHRQQGFLVPSGNPNGVRGISDIHTKKLRFINRNQGSGTRLWFDDQLRSLKLDPQLIAGYDNTVNTHARVAQAVRDGHADIGLAVRAAAGDTDLAFIPLFEERYDLVFPEEESTNKSLVPFLDRLNTKTFKKLLESLGGYNPHATGNEIHPQEYPMERR
jgi:putative molybdopterin biosynthesis protein